VNELCSNPEFSDHEPVLRDALIAHQQHLDTISTFPLVAVIEGILVPFFKELQGVSSKHNQLSSQILDIPASVVNRAIGLEATVCLVKFFDDCVYRFVNWNTDPADATDYDKLSRHGLFHGISLQGTRLNTLRCFLILELVSRLLPWIRADAAAASTQSQSVNSSPNP
jgi:hypothetical protein